MYVVREGAHRVPIWVAALAILTSATAAQQAPTPPGDAPFAERAAPWLARLNSARVQLADAAFEAGLWREASVLAAAVLQREPEHAVGKVVERIKQMDPEQFVRTYCDAAKKHGRAFQKRMHGELSPIAEGLFALGNEALAAKSNGDAEQMFVRAYEVDPDFDKARQALVKLDYDAIFNYGVLPKTDKEAARKVLKTLGGGFLGRSDLSAELETWSDAWGMQTRHYRFVSNAPHTTVFAFAQACEDLHEALDAFLKGSRMPARALNRPSTVYLFRNKIDYECVPRLQGNEPIDSAKALGFYDPSTKIGYFYCDDEFYGGDPVALFETFYHEGAHQQFDLRLKAAWRGDAQGSELNWVEEGLATYLESLVVEGENGARRLAFGTILDDDLQSAVEASDAGELRRLADFVHMDESAWDEYELGYPHAALVMHWLLEGDGGKRRAAAFDLLLAERQNGGLRKGDFFDVVKLDAAAADAALKAHARDIAQRLRKRAQ